VAQSRTRLAGHTRGGRPVWCRWMTPDRPFHRLVKWRTGSEGRIAYLKRRYGWRRTRLRGHNGAKIWCGYGVFAHNLGKIAALTA
jgi:transposase, IS5 family